MWYTAANTSTGQTETGHTWKRCQDLILWVCVSSSHTLFFILLSYSEPVTSEDDVYYIILLSEPFWSSDIEVIELCDRDGNKCVKAVIIKTLMIVD